MRTLYDPKCLELAQYFYPTASKDQLDDLSQQFQECAEDFCDPDNPEMPRTVRALCKHGNGPTCAECASQPEGDRQ